MGSERVGNGHKSLGRLALVAAFLLSLLPLAFCPIPPTVDYVNHLARVHVLANYSPDGPYAPFYVPHWKLFGNLGLDLVAVPLAAWIGTANAGTVFWALMIVVFVSGCAMLQRELTGRLTPLAALPALALYGSPTSYGFANYVFGTGLCLLGMGLAIRLRDRPWVRSAVCATFVTLLFLSHLMTLAFFLLLLATYDLWAKRLDGDHGPSGKNRIAPLTLSFVLAAALFLASPTTQEAGATEWWGLKIKLKALALTFNTGFFWPDMAFTALFAAVLAILLWKRRLAFSRTGLLLALPLLVVFLIAPYRLRAIDLIDFRMTQLLAAVLLAAIRLGPGVEPVKAAVAVLAVFAVRTGFTCYAYAEGNRTYAQLRRDLRGLPQNSILVGAIHKKGGEIAKGHWMPPLHLAYGFAILNGKPFISGMFMESSSHPLWLTPLEKKLRVAYEVPPLDDPKAYWARKASECRDLVGSSPEIGGWDGYFYYVRPAEEHPAATGLPVVAQGKRYAILRFK